MVKYIISAVIALALILFLRFYLPKKINELKMKKYGKRQELNTYIKLAARFGRKRVFKNLFIPVHTKEGVFDTELDALCITQSGIAIIEVKGNKGLIENKGERWCQRHKDKILYFEDPHEQNDGHIKALKKELGRRGENIPLFNYVLFTGENVRFTHSYPWLFSSTRVLCAELEKQNEKPLLSQRDIKRLSKLLKKYKKPKNTTFSKRRKR